MRTFKEKNCKYCGTSYVPTGSSSYFCSDTCRYNYYKETGKLKIYRDTFNKKAGCMVGVGSGGLTKTGKDNPAYRNGNGSYRYYGRKLKESGVPCNRCGKDLTTANRGAWCTHHIDEDRTNNSIENLELLCKRCHQIHHDCGYKSLPSLKKVQRLSRQGVDVTDIEAPDTLNG